MSNNVRIAAPDRMKVVPSFVVKELTEASEREIIVYGKEGKRETKVVKGEPGFLVTFPAKGHSIRVRDRAELKRLGFDRTIPLVNANGDEDDPIGDMPNPISA